MSTPYLEFIGLKEDSRDILLFKCDECIINVSRDEFYEQIRLKEEKIADAQKKLMFTATMEGRSPKTKRAFSRLDDLTLDYKLMKDIEIDIRTEDEFDEFVEKYGRAFNA